MTIRRKYGTPALGRGLDALLDTSEVNTGGSSNIGEVDVMLIKPNPDQPRREFNEESLRELADSIAQIGIVQPITLRDTGDGFYTIIAGERRWRACQMAGLERVPAYIRTVDDENMMEMALVENIQRQDLTALEVALAYQHLIEQYGLTQEQLSEKVGKNRATVTNYLRLLKLPAPIQVALKERQIDMGHARALLSLDDPKAQLHVFDEMVANGLSVRRVEEMVKELSAGGTVKGKDGKRIRQKGSTLSTEYNVLRDSLSSFFQTKVQMTCSDKGKGKISIPFANEAELERIMGIFDRLKS
ncbi:MAG: ParB/RepB/Spo0J family partition protein [Sodaliphilus sp.]|nr:ParB/RepB/Spo0J family partition protein [Prevotellaceae bacterium]MDY3734849.1 ParB/RepB/Spo0J family partition protein [Sodaliphilus sp.]MDY5599973.1 ParB/RepB/Spo0J family partition protein [Bacteroidaceae bacterium]MDD7658743.1 ParB/RepB/Spo0J family partition protein [Prevotellaceae bacterium]MDY5672612.1 ParB/RepB/Spo0J family partition protein [Bacteroidaceae bacterium]